MKKYEADEKFINRMVRMGNLKSVVCGIAVLAYVIYFIATNTTELEFFFSEIAYKLGIAEKSADLALGLYFAGGLLDMDGFKMRLYISLIVIVMIFVWDHFKTKKINTVIENIEREYLEIFGNTVRGMACFDPTKADSVKYFELTADKIRMVEIDEPQSRPPYVYWNLALHTAHGTYRLCIENRTEAEETVKRMMQTAPHG